MILTKIKEFVKTYQADIILVIGVILISLLSFAMGYIAAKTQEKEPIKIEKGVEEGSFFSTFAFPSDSEVKEASLFSTFVFATQKLGGGRRKFTFFALATRKLVEEGSFFSTFAFPSDSEGGRRKFTFFALATRKLGI